MSIIKLRPCPFCGGRRFWIEVTKRWAENYEYPFDNPIYDAKISCFNCGSGIKNIAHDTEEDALKEAADLWNTR